MKSSLLIAILSAACAAQTQTLRVVPVHLDATVSIPTIQFFCTQDYDRRACVNDALALRHALLPYPLEQLGAWSFVLAPSEDWKNLVHGLGGPPGSPAFSILEERVTVLDQSLFSWSADRGAELLHKFGVIGPPLVDLAVAHELGHGLCVEKDEHRAYDYGRGLRNGKVVHCSKAPEHATANTSRRYKEWLDSNGSRGNSGKYRHYPH